MPERMVRGGGNTSKSNFRYCIQQLSQLNWRGIKNNAAVNNATTYLEKILANEFWKDRIIKNGQQWQVLSTLSQKWTF